MDTSPLSVQQPMNITNEMPPAAASRQPVSAQKLQLQPAAGATQAPGLNTDSGFFRDEVEKLVDSLREVVDVVQRRLSFSVHQETNDIVVKVIDKQTDEVIIQIPPDKLLKLREDMVELTGIMFSDCV